MSEDDSIVVYMATNLITDNQYIGMTISGLKKRKREHFFAARHKTDGGRSHFYNSIRKYGECNFSFNVVFRCSSQREAFDKEIELIERLKPVYNKTKGGEGNVGYKASDKTRKLLSEALKRRDRHPRLGKTHSEETKQRLREINTAKPANYWLGKSRSQETIEKIRKTKTGVPRSPMPASAMEVYAENMRRAARARRKKVVCLDDGQIFESAQAASLHYGFCKSAVAAVAGGRRKAVHGMRFEYARI